jgi:hypothetical protein
MDSMTLRKAKVLLAIQEVMMAPEWFGKDVLLEVLEDATRLFDTSSGDLWGFEKRFLEGLKVTWMEGLEEIDKD